MDSAGFQILMCFLGWASHHLSVLAEMSQSAGEIISPVAYAKRRPYKLALSIIGTVIGYAILYELGEVTALTAIGVGYMADSSVDRFGKITARKLGNV